jgi:hypothetical protein
VNTFSSPVEPLSFVARESLLLAPYAMHSALSRGRKFPEPAHPYRGPRFSETATECFTAQRSGD